MQKQLTIAVLGAGNGGQAMAADLASRGYQIHLWNRSLPRIQPLLQNGGIQLEGLLKSYAQPSLITTDLAAAIRGAGVILVAVTANAHRSLARHMAPFLEDGQILVLCPGRTGGALEVSEVLRESGTRKRLYLAEAQSLPYACRITGPASVHIAGIKRSLPLSALPAADTPHVMNVMQELFPSLVPARHVLETSLGNIGAIFHPSIAVLSASRIEQAESFSFYKNVTPGIASFIERLDEERLSVGKAFGVELASAAEWISRVYDETRGDTLYDRIRTNTAYDSIAAPASLNTRLLFEEIPTGLIPLAALGRIVDVPTPLCNSLSIIASALTGENYFSAGRTLTRLGISGMTTPELMRYLLHGTRKDQANQRTPLPLGRTRVNAILETSSRQPEIILGENTFSSLS